MDQLKKPGETSSKSVDTRFLQRGPDATDSTIKPRLLVNSEGDFYQNSNQFHNEQWYQNLTKEQKRSFDSFITTDSKKVDVSNDKYSYTIKEVLRKIGANLSSVLGRSPDEFGERETVLAGGYPRNTESLSHIIEAYHKNHNLKVYDIYEEQILPPLYKRKLEQEEMLSNIEFHFGRPLFTLGEVPNHDILIPHPGPKWIEGSLPQELNHVLGPGSKAYILTDSTDFQKEMLKNKLEQYYPSLCANDKKIIDENDIGTIITLGDIPIQTTQYGPYYVIEVYRK